MQDITIVPVASSARVRQFVELPYELYAGNDNWTPPLRRDEYRRLSPRHNPFFEHATADLFLALRGSTVVGRIAAIHDRLYDDAHHERVTWFGFFEARDPAATAALLASVEATARRRGSDLVRGPANPSLNESAGLLVDAFDARPYILMPYNPPDYAAFIEGAGYHRAKDLLAWTIDVTPTIGERIARVAERLRRRPGVTVRTADMRHFERDVGILQDIYRHAWEENWGFVPPTEREIHQLAVDLKPIVDPELALFAEVDGTPVGVAVAIPDVNQVLQLMKGNLFPFGLFHFLRRRSIITQLRVLLLGVVPSMRKTGLYALLVSELHRHARARGYQRAELSWTLEDNAAVNAGIQAAGGRPYKTYRVYEKPVSRL